jgi:hydrogenase-4 component F
VGVASLGLAALVALPLIWAAAGWRLGSARRLLDWVCAGVCVQSGLCLLVAVLVGWEGSPPATAGWLFLDALSGYHLLVLMAVYLLSSFAARGFFAHEIDRGTFGVPLARQFAALWMASLAAMTLVLVSNNLGLMWVGMEATTLVTAFLIYVHRTPRALEAMWKYLLICSVGIAFAFMGTLLVATAATQGSAMAGEALLWTGLRDRAGTLDATTMKAAFVFLLVGYGTKAGLAPLHNWLPDAHSQAPAPVSAVFSGFMLNASLYCLMRYVPLVEGSTGQAGWARALLQVIGVVSILVAAAFILFQHDVKRLLAYHSVEHLGIIVVGLGLGGTGTFAALFHMLNHSLCKTLGFLCAGRLGQLYRTHDMTALTGTVVRARLWGWGLLLSFLALIGAAPFAIFMSELLVLKAAIDARAVTVLVLFLLGTATVFVGALRHAIAMAWGSPAGTPYARPATAIDIGVVSGGLALLVVLGLWMPQPLLATIAAAARIIGGQE